MEENVTRKLTAILYADVAGYSRLTGEDELGTHKRLGTALDLISGTIESKGGSVVHYAGDAVLADFGSVVAAVDCAVSIQRELAERNAKVADDKRLQFRVGVNLGEVIVDRGDIYGDGVNVAARLESLAEPGGVCISASVHEQVDGKLEISCEDLGEQSVKNIARPVRAYRVKSSTTGAADTPLGATVTSAPEIPDKPSIAVLPFDNMSGESEQEYFSDGITEEIITALSRFRWFFVVACNSTFAYRGQSVDVRQVSKELGVRYVLEGSVRKSGERVRISAQLIDASTGNHIWADRYDRELDDILSVQDDITESIVTAVAPEFLSAEMQRAQRKEGRNLDSWDYTMRARWHIARFTKEDNKKAQDLLRKAIATDDRNAGAFSDFAFTHLIDTRFGWGESRAQSFAEAEQAARQAVEIDVRDAEAYATLGYVDVYSNRHDDAIRALERAVDLNPNLSNAYGNLGLALEFSGRSEEAVEQFEKAMRLSPRDPYMVIWLSGMGIAAFVAERYDDMIEWGKKTVREKPEYPAGHRLLASAYGNFGQLGEAREALEELLRLVPALTIGDVNKQMPFKNPADTDRYLNGLRKAGLPD